MIWNDKTCFWQYNGIAPFYTINEWCQQHLDPMDWQSNLEMFFFKDESIKAFFLLRWS